MNRHNRALVSTLILLLFCVILIVGELPGTPAIAQEPTPIPLGEVAAPRCTGLDNTALDHYRRATEFDRAGQNEEAAREYLLAIQCDRDYVMAYRGLARAYEQQGRTDEAIAFFEQMLENDPRNALAHYAIGWLYWNAKDDWENTEAEWRAALEIDPQCALALNGMGIVYEHSDDEDAALAMYRAAVAADPSLKLPRNNIMNMYSVGLTDEKAQTLIASFEESLRADPHQNFAGEKRYLIGMLYDLIGQREQGRQSFQQLLVEYPDSPWADYAHFAIAVYHMVLGQYAQALELLTIGIDKYPRSAVAGEMLVMLGVVQMALGNTAEAYESAAEALCVYPDLDRQVAEQAEELLGRLDAEVVEIVLLNEHGLDAMSRNDYEGALAYCKGAEEMAISHGDTGGRLEALRCLGAVSEVLGKYVDAQNYYQESLDIALDEKDELSTALASGGLGNQALRQKEYYVALTYYEQALEHLKQVSDTRAGPSLVREYTTKAYNDIGVVYLELGEYELALDWIQRALDSTGKVGTRSQTLTEEESAIVALANLGIIHTELGELGAAYDHLARALELCKSGVRLGHTCVTPHQNMADLYLDMGKPDKALSELELVLESAIEDQVPYWEIGIRENIGEVYMAQDDHESALMEFEMALDIGRSLDQLVREASVLNSLGDCYCELGQKTTALRYYRDAAAAFEEYVGGLSFGETRARAFVQGPSSIYMDWVTLLIEMGEEREAFEAAERARARAFLDSMAIGPIDFREGADFDLLERERALRTEITALDNRLRAEISQPRDEQNAQVIENLQVQLEEKRSEYSLILNQIQATNPEYASLAMVSTATVTETQQSLDDQTTLLEYFVASEEETVAFVLTHDSFNAITIPVGSDQLAEEITVFRDFASRDQPRPKSLVQLYEWLIAPVREYLHTPFLGIVPHGVLHYLPFAALTDGEHYLMDDFTLFSLPSASVLPFVQQHAAQTDSGLLALAQPDAEGLSHLAYAVEEAETIAGLWGTRAMVGEDATETAVYDQVSDAGVVHIAAHGEFHPFSPLFSAVVLSADDQNDGRLEVHEVYGLDLTQADLVVLSGCQTDMAHLSDGDELIGLNRALLFAGTPTVVGSLWRVDDESTSFLMEQFHVYLREGMGKAEALRQAQIDARDRYPHPYYWAGFVLTGDHAGATIVSQEARPKTEVPPTVSTPVGDDGGRIPWWAYVSGVSLTILGVVIWMCFRKHK